MPVAELRFKSMEKTVDSNADSPSDLELLRGFYKDRSSEAMALLFERHVDSAYRVATAYLGNSADADEVVQTAFLQVLTRGQGCSERDDSNVKGWLMTA